MSLRMAQVLRVLTALAFALVVFLAIRLVNRPNPYQRPEPEKGQGVTVRDAIGRGQEKEITVTGYIFEGGGWEDIRLCDQRKSGSPPQCVAPFVYVSGVDRGSFELKSKNTKHGVARWSPGPVTLAGFLSGVELQVSTVLGSNE